MTLASLGTGPGVRGAGGGTQRGGVAKGKLTEVCGPPGSGKATFAYVP